MDEVFGEIMGCGFSSDSIMLRLLRSAMDKAHENVQSTDGSVELLNARSRFYELAMILVEGCSKLIEEKAEVPEINREKMLSDLMESEDMVRGRLEELQLGIVDKDRELMERLENEGKLRQTLELKERELVSLRAKLEVERTKSEALLNDQTGGDEGREGEICELKNSVDQQVWSIKQKLEDETPMSPFARPEQNMVIEQMSCDIDGLKGTLDFAFGRMQNAEMRPLEKQWRWKIEKDTMVILIQGFMDYLRHNFESQLEKRAGQNQVPTGFLAEHWPELIDEITGLHRELEDLCCPNEGSAKRDICRASSEPLPEVNYTEEPHEEARDGDGSHYVAKMIKNHESIIRKQREELNWLKREILREKENLSSKRLKDNYPNSLGRRIQDVIASLDIVIKWNAKIGTYKGVYVRENFPRKEKMSTDSLADFGERVEDDSVFCRRQTDLNDEMRKLKQERDDSNLQTAIMEETYVILLKGLMKDFNLELHAKETKNFPQKMSEEVSDDLVWYKRQTELNDEMKKLKQERDDSNLQSVIIEETYLVLFKGLTKDFSLELRNHETESLIRDDICMYFFREMVNELSIKFEIESVLKEDIYMVFFREMTEEWKAEMDAYNFANLIREEIYHFTIVEAAKDAYIFTRESENPSQENFAEDLLSARNSDTSLEVCGEENLIRKLDSLLKCFEAEEDLMLKASSEIKEHSADNDLVASECEEVDERDAIEWLLTEEESTFSSVSNKLDKALQQLFMSKALLRELQQFFCQPKDNQIAQLNPSDSTFSRLVGFQQMLADFEIMVHQKLEMNFLRLEELAHQIYVLIQLVASIRRKGLLYRKAFSRRCHNLRLAETEVDLLGDQVDVLLCLLEKVYLILDQYSPVLSRYFGVSDILKLIEKELRAAHTTQLAK